jgi:hypothetical protein
MNLLKEDALAYKTVPVMQPQHADQADKVKMADGTLSWLGHQYRELLNFVLTHSFLHSCMSDRYSLLALDVLYKVSCNF